MQISNLCIHICIMNIYKYVPISYVYNLQTQPQSFLFYIKLLSLRLAIHQHLVISITLLRQQLNFTPTFPSNRHSQPNKYTQPLQNGVKNYFVSFISLCRVMQCYVMQYNAMLCYVKLCNIMLCTNSTHVNHLQYMNICIHCILFKHIYFIECFYNSLNV